MKSIKEQIQGDRKFGSISYADSERSPVMIDFTLDIIARRKTEDEIERNLTIILNEIRSSWVINRLIERKQFIWAEKLLFEYNFEEDCIDSNTIYLALLRNVPFLERILSRKVELTRNGYFVDPYHIFYEDESKRILMQKYYPEKIIDEWEVSNDLSKSQNSYVVAIYVFENILLALNAPNKLIHYVPYPNGLSIVPVPNALRICRIELSKECDSIFLTKEIEFNDVGIGTILQVNSKELLLNRAFNVELRDFGSLAKIRDLDLDLIKPGIPNSGPTIIKKFQNKLLASNLNRITLLSKNNLEILDSVLVEEIYYIKAIEQVAKDIYLVTGLEEPYYSASILIEFKNDKITKIGSLSFGFMDVIKHQTKDIFFAIRDSDELVSYKVNIGKVNEKQKGNTLDDCFELNWKIRSNNLLKKQKCVYSNNTFVSIESNKEKLFLLSTNCLFEVSFNGEVLHEIRFESIVSCNSMTLDSNRNCLWIATSEGIYLYKVMLKELKRPKIKRQ